MSSIRRLLLFAVIGFLLFALVAWNVERAGTLVAIDIWVANQLQEHAEAHPCLLNTFRHLTHLGSVGGLFMFTTIGVVLLTASGRRRLAVLWIAAATSGALVNVTLKEIFDRPRPDIFLRDSAVSETNESFPSGHSMGATIGYAMAGYAVWQVRLARRRGWWVVLVVVAMAGSIGFSRMYLRAHYCSDVVGAFAMGGAWVCLWLALDQWLQNRLHTLRPRTHSAVAQPGDRDSHS